MRRATIASLALALCACVVDERHIVVAAPGPVAVVQPQPGRSEPGVVMLGCADGTRESFLDVTRNPNIAGCAGGWSEPGAAVTPVAHCSRSSGDDARDPSGRGCSAEDLCADGWHVCASAAEVEARSPDGCDPGSEAADSFFMTRQSGPGCTFCATGARADCGGNECVAGCAPSAATTNDLFGCGSLGGTPSETCAPLDRFSNDQCSELPQPWSCNDGADGTAEARAVRKLGPEHGGVLCCR